jgi:hypothetical protein
MGERSCVCWDCARRLSEKRTPHGSGVSIGGYGLSDVLALGEVLFVVNGVTPERVRLGCRGALMMIGSGTRNILRRGIDT